jgi:putative lipoic acid-binding regulatory protein
MKYYDHPVWYSAPPIFLSIAFFLWSVPGIFPWTIRGVPADKIATAVLVLLALFVVGFQVCRASRDAAKCNKRSVNINLTFDNMSPEQITAFRILLKDL